MAEYEVNFPQTQEGVRNLSWPELRKMVEPDKGTRKNRDPYNLANLEMARRILINWVTSQETPLLSQLLEESLLPMMS